MRVEATLHRAVIQGMQTKAKSRGKPRLFFATTALGFDPTFPQHQPASHLAGQSTAITSVVNKYLFSLFMLSIRAPLSTPLEEALIKHDAFEWGHQLEAAVPRVLASHHMLSVAIIHITF